MLRGSTNTVPISVNRHDDFITTHYVSNQFPNIDIEYLSIPNRHYAYDPFGDYTRGDLEFLLAVLLSWGDACKNSVRYTLVTEIKAEIGL